MSVLDATNNAAASLAGLGSTALTVAANGDIGKRNRKFYREERLATQEYNTSERLAAQQYNEDMWRKNNEYNEEIYNRYQSPEALKRQYLAAGLNPALALEGGSAGSIGSASSTAAGSSGQSSIPVQSSAAAYPFLPNDTIGGAFVNIANAIKAIGEAKKTGVETSQLEQLFGENLKGLKLTNLSKELANSMDVVRLSYLDYKQRLEVQQAFKNLCLTDLKTEEIQRNIDILIEKGLIAKNERENWYKRFDAELSNTEADTNLKGAQANAANASANANNALAAFTRTKNVTQQFVNSMNEKFGSEIRACERDLLQQQKAYNQDTFVQRVNMVSSTLEKMSWEIEKLRAEGRWAEINQILHAAGSLANTAMNVGIGFRAFKGKAKGVLEDAAEAGFYNDNGPEDPPQPFN